MDLDPASLPAADRYKILIGTIVPRPIAFVSTISPDGRTNLAPFSFFNGVCATPMTLLFCPSNKHDGTEKDTLRNILAGSGPSGAGGEFVVNVAAEPYIRRVVACAEELPYGESEFALSGLASSPSATVHPPRVADSPISFECRSERIVRLAPGQPGGGNIVIGRVIHIHARDGIIDAGHHVDPAALAAVGRMAGMTYCTTRDRFEVPRGRKALEST